MTIIGIKLEVVLRLQNKKRSSRCPMGIPRPMGYPHAIVFRYLLVGKITIMANVDYVVDLKTDFK